MQRRLARAFTLAELAVVVALIGVAMGLGVASMVDMVGVQRRNAALAQANLTLREERARALEARRPRYVMPDPVGNGLVVGTATAIRDVNEAVIGCTGFVIEQRIELPTLEARGDPVCFVEDGSTDSQIPLTLDFVPANAPGGTDPVAEVKVFPAGTMKWLGTSLSALHGGCASAVSVKNIASQTISPVYLQ